MKRLAGPAILVLVVAAWWVTLRPAPLGGPAAFVVVSGHSMQPALAPGSLVVARRRAAYRAGDVIVYRLPGDARGQRTRVIHRVVGGSAAAGYVTRGDNRAAPDRWRPRPRDIEGAKLVAVPFAGRALMLLATPAVLGGLIAMLAFLMSGEPLRPRRRGAAVGEAGPAHTAPTAATSPLAVQSAPVAAHAPPVATEPPVAVELAPLLSAPTPRRSRSRDAHRRALAAGGAVAGGVAAGVLVTRHARRR